MEVVGLMYRRRRDRGRRVGLYVYGCRWDCGEEREWDAVEGSYIGIGKGGSVERCLCTP